MDFVVRKIPEKRFSKKYSFWFGFNIENTVFFICIFYQKQKLITETSERKLFLFEKICVLIFRRKINFQIIEI